MENSNIDKDTIYRLLASGRESYLAAKRPLDQVRSSTVEEEPDMLLNFLADTLMDEQDEDFDEKVQFEREKFPDLKAGMVY
jgi:hypothetical protein